jgi:hypothetical protein
MNRDDFVSQLIAELEKQQKNSNSDFNDSNRWKSSNEIYRTLCYDYPIVSSHGIYLHYITNYYN